VRRYRFRLEQALRVRRVQEDLAKAALSEAQRRLAAVERALAERLDRYRATPGPGGALPSTAFLEGRARHRLAAATVLAAGVERQLALETVAGARDAWRAAAMKVQALERLDRRRREEHGIELARHEELAVDDLVTGMAARRREEDR
jgi:flagellar protein FliJ